MNIIYHYIGLMVFWFLIVIAVLALLYRPIHEIVDRWYFASDVCRYYTGRKYTTKRLRELYKDYHSQHHHKYILLHRLKNIKEYNNGK